MATNSTNTSSNSQNDFSLALNVFTGLLGVESIAIIVTNSMVFVLFAKSKELRRKSNYCLVSLAMSDFLVGLVIFPLFSVCNYLDYLSSCDAMDLIQRFLVFSNILHILLAICDRYIKISQPFRHRTFITGKRIIAALVCVWLISLAVSLTKIPFLHSGQEQQKLIYSITVLVVMASIPFVIIVIINVHTRWLIVKSVKKSRNLMKTVRRNQNNQRTVLIYFVIAVIAFVLGSVSYFILGIVELSMWETVFCASLTHSVHFITPLLYTFFKADFKKAFKEMISNTNSSNTNSYSPYATYSHEASAPQFVSAPRSKPESSSGVTLA